MHPILQTRDKPVAPLEVLLLFRDVIPELLLRTDGLTGRFGFRIGEAAWIVDFDTRRVRDPLGLAPEEAELDAVLVANARDFMALLRDECDPEVLVRERRLELAGDPAMFRSFAGLLCQEEAS